MALHTATTAATRLLQTRLARLAGRKQRFKSAHGDIWRGFISTKRLHYNCNPNKTLPDWPTQETRDRREKEREQDKSRDLEADSSIGTSPCRTR